jgi:CubicO group peptidase (beta-lactamase class C family)
VIRFEDPGLGTPAHLLVDVVVTFAAAGRDRPHTSAGAVGKARPAALAAALLLWLCLSCTGAANAELAELVAELDAKIPEVVASGRSPSLQVAVVHRDRLVWSRAFGENASVDHVYMNGSVQKVFDAVAVLKLVEKGAVDLDGDVNSYLPFTVRHPRFPHRPITVRMLLDHRSGLVAFPHQFDWDTECLFSPRDRRPCDTDLPKMSLGEYIEASLRSETPETGDGTWFQEPGTRFRYSIAAYPLLRYLVEQVSRQSFPEFMRENLFAPLEMTSSGFSADEFADRHVVPYTRVGGKDVALPVWNGNGFVMHTTAADQSRLMIALMNGGRFGDREVLRPETIALMSDATTRFSGLFKSSDDLQWSGHGLGLLVFRGGWLGYGGSTPGFQCLWRFHPSKQVGYVILSNVNAIGSGPEDNESVRREVYSVQNALLAILDPGLIWRSRTGELTIAGAIALGSLAGVLYWRRRARTRKR